MIAIDSVDQIKLRKQTGCNLEGPVHKQRCGLRQELQIKGSKNIGHIFTAIGSQHLPWLHPLSPIHVCPLIASNAGHLTHKKKYFYYNNVHIKVDITTLLRTKWNKGTTGCKQCQDMSKVDVHK